MYFSFFSFELSLFILLMISHCYPSEVYDSSYRQLLEDETSTSSTSSFPTARTGRTSRSANGKKIVTQIVPETEQQQQLSIPRVETVAAIQLVTLPLGTSSRSVEHGYQLPVLPLQPPPIQFGRNTDTNTNTNNSKLIPRHLWIALKNISDPLNAQMPGTYGHC